jgi:hypothetical protein
LHFFEEFHMPRIDNSSAFPRHVDEDATTARSTPASPPGSPPVRPSSSGGAAPELAGLTPARLARGNSGTGTGSARQPAGGAEHRAPAPPRRVTVADLAHTMQNLSGKRESTQTSSLFGRVRTRPAKGVQLPFSGPALAPAPAPPRRGRAPAPPAVGVSLPSGPLGVDRANVLRTMRTAVKQIAPEVPKPAGTGNPAASSAVQQIAPDVPKSAGIGKPAAPIVALYDEVTLKDHVRNLFTQPRNPMRSEVHAAALFEQLMPALAGPPAPRASTLPTDDPATSFPHTQHLLVAEHLAQACGGDAQRATAALATLCSGVQVDAMLQHLNAGTLGGAPLDALRTAVGLASTHAGFQALLKMIQPPPDPEHHAGLQRLLTAAGKVAEEGKSAHGDSALAQAGTRAALKMATHVPATLAETVLAVELGIQHTQRTLAAVLSAASPYAALPAAHKAAVFAWKHGFRESGPGTDLAKLQGRLAKFGKYVERASKHERNRATKLDIRKPATAAPFVKAQARLAMSSLNNVFGRKKSPLTPLRAMGVNNAAMGYPDDDITALDKHIGTAMNALSEHLALQLPAAGSEAHAAMARGLATPGTPLPPALERSALLNHVTGTMEQVRPFGHVLDKGALMQVALNIARQHGVPESGVQVLAAKLAHWEGKSVTLAHVRDWAKEGGLRETEPAPRTAGGAAPPTARQETAFGAALRKAANIVDPATNRPVDLTPDGVHAFVRTFLQEHVWGNSVIASNGGNLGVNMGALSVSLKEASEHFTALLTGGVKASVVPVADVRGTRTRNAVFGFGSVHHGGELFLGTERQYAGGVGFGIMTSLRKGISRLGIQGSAKATVSPVAGDKGYVRGVMVRSMREEKPDGEAWNTAKSRDELVKFVDVMFDLAKRSGGKMSAEQTWEHLANEFLESETLSIGWHSQSSGSLHHTAAVSASVSATGIALDKPFEAVGAGLAGGLTADVTSGGVNRRTERSGEHRMIRNNAQSRLLVTGNLGAATVSPSIPAAGGSATFVPGATPHDPPLMVHGPDPTAESLNVGTPLFGTRANFNLMDKGMTVAFRALVGNGRLSETYTLRDVDYRDPGQFKAMLAMPGRKEQFEQVFIAAHGPETGPQELQKLMGKVENWAGPGQRFMMRSRLRMEVRKGLDESAALASAIHARDPRDPRLAELSAHMMAGLSDEDSWVPFQLVNFEVQNAADVRGLDFGAVATANHKVASERELYSTSPPPDVVRAWARQPAQPAEPGQAAHPDAQTT